MKILHIESSEAFRQLVKHLLTGTHYQITQVDGLHEAIQYCKQQRFDLILMSRNLNSGDAFHFCHQLREQGEYATTPIIIYVTQITSQLKEQSYRYGVSQLLLRQELSETLQTSLSAFAKTDTLREPIHVVYIEDNRVLQILMQRFLESEVEYKVSVFNNATDGLHFIKQHAVDLVLQDLNLPDMTGWELIELIRSDELTRTLNVLAVTGEILSDEKQQKIELFFQGVITKPFERNNLLNRLKQFQ